MVKFNVYLIIDFKVFGLTINDNFLFTVIVKRFYAYNHAVEE